MPRRPPFLHTRRKFVGGILRPRYEHHAESGSYDIEAAIGKRQFLRIANLKVDVWGYSFGRLDNALADINANDARAARLEASRGPAGARCHIQACFCRSWGEPGYNMIQCIRNCFTHALIGRTS